MNSETKWNSAGNTPREKKTHTKHLLKYTYHEKSKGLHDYLHMYGVQTHRIQIYAKLRIAHIILMSLSSFYLDCSRHVARLRCRRRVYAPTSNTASHDNREKINSWVFLCFPYGYGAPLGGPSGRRSSAIM